MATVSIFVCPGANQSTSTVTLSTSNYGTCTQGQGRWQNVVIAEPFDPSLLNGAELAGAFGVGFTMFATGLVIVWAARMVIGAIRD
jgi:hypothetical protein